MTLTLLLDLDDTLLINPLQAFQKQYFQLLGQYIHPLIPAEQMLPALMRGTEAMLRKGKPSGTLENTFYSVFYPNFNVSPEQIASRFASFYQDIFPQLQSITRPRPGAAALVHNALAQNWRVVVATNPLFPRTAIEQRLAWAGLDPASTPFSLVTAFETSHFAKPHPEYYAEILARLGWPTDPVVMVGNELKDDIAPAASLGLATYYLTDENITLPADENGLHGRGSFDQLWDFLLQVAAQAEFTLPNSPQALLPGLAATPAALDTLGFRLNQQAWAFQPAPQEWSLTEIACHLRDVDQDINEKRVSLLQSEDNPFLPGVVSDTWATERDYRSQDGPQALADFTGARERLLNLLASLSPEGWQRTARHAIFGPTRLQELVGFMFQHDRNHIQQALENIRQFSIADLASSNIA